MAKFRYENKYLISYPDFEALKVRMKPYFSMDPHATYGEYMIRSLYFDDYFHSAYEEKDMGIFFRKKYRIRIYNCSDSSIKLERKLKQGKYILKESAPLSKDEFYSILNGNYGFLLQSPHNLLKEFYYECISSFLRPRVIVDYDRTPFILDEGTVRVTFDKRVRAAVGSFDIFDKDLFSLSCMPSDKLIMEVKYKELLPRLVRQMITGIPTEMVAASKYVMCCEKTAYLNGPGYYEDERNLV